MATDEVIAWNITLDNKVAAPAVTQKAFPEDLTVTRKVFENFEITLNGYVPLRFLGIDDNKVGTKRAIRVMDGSKPFEIGYDTETVFKITLFEEGDLYHYTIEGGTADKTTKRTLIGGSLGPKEFITDEQRINYYNMQVFVKTMYYLRATKYTDIQAWQNDLKADAKKWDSDIYPRILTVATDIVDYARQSQSSAEGFLEAMNEIGKATGQERQDIIDGVKQILKDLRTVAQKNHDNADQIYKDLGDYSITLTTRLSTGTALDKTYEEKIGANSSEQKYLRDRIKLLNDGLPGKRELYHKYCLLAETSPCYLVVPIVGIVAAAVMAGVFGDKAKRMLDEIHDDENEITAKSKQLEDDQAEMTSLGSAKSGVEANIGLIGKAQAAVDSYRGSWGAIAGDLDKNIQQLDSATPDKPFAFKYSQLSTLKRQWQALEANADQFRVTAFITVKQPGS